MKKLHIMVLTAAMTAAMATGVYAKPIVITNANSTADIREAIKNSITSNLQGNVSIEDICKQIGWNGNTSDCPAINIPNINKPNTDKPNTDKPNTNLPSQNESQFAQEVVRLVNIERQKAGLSALTMNTNIQKAAQVRAQEQEQSFSHTRPNGSSFSTALNENGVSYRGSGENIAWGQKTPQAVMDAWMNSPGHRANILNEKFTSIGVGYYQSSNSTPYWAQLFTY